MSERSSSRYAHFGMFRLNVETGELWHSGRPVRLRRQPARLLSLLVMHANQLVTHEQIIRHLWGNRIVEYDQGVHACIRQIRAALGDDAARPDWVETVPRHGYRFVGVMDMTSPAASRARASRLARATAAVAACTALFWSGALPGDTQYGPQIVFELGNRQWDLAPAIRHELDLLSGIALPVVSIRPGPSADTRAWFVTAGGDTTTLLSVRDRPQPQDGAGVVRRTLAAHFRDAVPLDSAPRRARDAFLKGQFVLQRHADERLETALDLFGQVVAAEPDFAPGHAGVAHAHLMRGEYPPARRAATRALAIDSGHAGAHLVMANLALYVDWNWSAALVHHMVTLRRYPGWSMAHVSYAFQLSAQGRHDEALSHAGFALELDPVSPVVHGDLGLLSLIAGKPELAAVHCRRTLELDTSQWFSRGCLVDALLATGDSVNAKREAAALMAALTAQETAVTTVRDAPPDRSLRSYWRWVLTWADRQSSRWYPYLAARAYMGLHDHDQAVQTLARAIDEHARTVATRDDGGRRIVGTAMLPALRVDPRFAPLRGDARFVKLLGTIARGRPRDSHDSDAGD